MSPELLAALAHVYFEAHRAHAELVGGYRLSPCWEKLDSGTRHEVIRELESFALHPDRAAVTPTEKIAKAVLGMRGVLESTAQDPPLIRADEVE